MMNESHHDRYPAQRLMPLGFDQLQKPPGREVQMFFHGLLRNPQAFGRLSLG